MTLKLNCIIILLILVTFYLIYQKTLEFLLKIMEKYNIIVGDVLLHLGLNSKCSQITALNRCDMIKQRINIIRDCGYGVSNFDEYNDKMLTLSVMHHIILNDWNAVIHEYNNKYKSKKINNLEGFLVKLSVIILIFISA